MDKLDPEDDDAAEKQVCFRFKRFDEDNTETCFQQDFMSSTPSDSNTGDELILSNL